MLLRNFKKNLAIKMPLINDLVDCLRGRKSPIFIDYKPKPIPRYDRGKQPHPLLYKIINRSREQYRKTLSQYLQYTEYFTRISVNKKSEYQPSWINGFLPGLDAISLYGAMALNNPKRYFEIGSGSSTKFVRQSIKDQGLRTRITSIDPFPRVEIDSLCDEVVRLPLEEIDISLFNKLEAGDILFVDNSHRSFANSDVTATFLDILPRLKKGVLVEFHDIFLPYDYCTEYAMRWYSEQYLLACYILAEGNKLRILLPNMFISRDRELSQVLTPLWEKPEMHGVEKHGVSFWIRIAEESESWERASRDD